MSFVILGQYIASLAMEYRMSLDITEHLNTLVEYVQLKISNQTKQFVTKQREEINPKSNIEQMGGQTENVKDMIN